MAGSANAKLKRETNAKVLGLRIYNQAGGEPITRRIVDDQLAQWQAHPPACRCGAPCDLAATVSVSRVWCVVWVWEASIARTRRLALTGETTGTVTRQSAFPGVPGVIYPGSYVNIV